MLHHLWLFHGVPIALLSWTSYWPRASATSSRSYNCPPGPFATIPASSGSHSHPQFARLRAPGFACRSYASILHADDSKHVSHLRHGTNTHGASPHYVLPKFIYTHSYHNPGFPLQDAQKALLFGDDKPNTGCARHACIDLSVMPTLPGALQRVWAVGNTCSRTHFRSLVGFLLLLCLFTYIFFALAFSFGTLHQYWRSRQLPPAYLAANL